MSFNPWQTHSAFSPPNTWVKLLLLCGKESVRYFFLTFSSLHEIRLAEVSLCFPGVPDQFLIRPLLPAVAPDRLHVALDHVVGAVESG